MNPLRISDELTDKFCGYLLEGLKIANVCALCRISESSYYSWMKQGGEGEEPYKTFRDRVEEANAEAARRIISKLTRSENEKTLQWILERRYGWNKEETHHVDGNVNITFNISEEEEDY